MRCRDLKRKRLIREYQEDNGLICGECGALIMWGQRNNPDRKCNCVECPHCHAEKNKAWDCPHCNLGYISPDRIATVMSA